MYIHYWVEVWDSLVKVSVSFLLLSSSMKFQTSLGFASGIAAISCVIYIYTVNLRYVLNSRIVDSASYLANLQVDVVKGLEECCIVVKEITMFLFTCLTISACF